MYFEVATSTVASHLSAWGEGSNVPGEIISPFLAALPNGKSALSALFSLDSNWDRLYFTKQSKEGFWAVGRQLGNNPADRRSELGEVHENGVIGNLNRTCR